MSTEEIHLVDNARACVLSLEDVDTLNDAAHRILLYGTLTANGLEDQCQHNLQLEALLDLVTLIIGHATTIERVMQKGSR